ncbi:hypothetical protein ACIPVK_06235 [Paeniglutamicibacter sp. MACA_103]|uniref:hypothetical protein n=1 Tax=Paeniglutamicibacter sp. MACA_103 TaxID=3377337 RepID=UPI003895993F
MTWQEAKAHSQAIELEIAELIPKDKVVKIEQGETGTLLSCSETEHNWNGTSMVTLVKDAEEEPLVRAIEAHYQDSHFTVENDVNISGNYRVQLLHPDSAENYLISAGWDTDTIRISSGSACFALPEGVSSRGEF